jgi:multiple sugar transport system substrate-binding protein
MQGKSAGDCFLSSLFLESRWRWFVYSLFLKEKGEEILNRRMKRVSVMAMSTIGVGMLVAGCGTAASNNTSNSSSSTPAATTSSAKKIHLVLTMWGSSLDQKTYQERADLYTKSHPNVTVSVKLLPNTNYDEKLETMIAGGDSPDIVEVSQDYAPLAAKGAIISLSSYVKKADMHVHQIYSKGYVSGYMYNNKLYALPDRGGYIALFYNKKMFKKAGLAYPKAGWTWSQFLTDARKLTIVKDGKTVQWGCAVDNWWPEYLAFTHSAGGHEVNQAGTKATMDSAAFRKGLQFYWNLIYKYHVSPDAKQWADYGSDINRDNLFLENKNAMSISGFWDISSFSNAHMDFGIAPVPVAPEGHPSMVTAGTGLAIASGSAHKNTAFKVIKFMTSAAGEMPIVTNHEDIPANKADVSAWVKTLPDGLSYKQMELSQQDIFSPRIPPQWNEMQTDISEDFTPLWDGTTTVKKATEAATKKVDSILAGN